METKTNPTPKTKELDKPVNPDRLRVGKAIRAIRQQRKVDAKTLAQMTGIDAGNLSRIEQGKYSVGLDMLSKIAHNLGCQVEITPLPEVEQESATAKNKRRYKNLDLELLTPDLTFDYENNWASANYLQALGVNLNNVSESQLLEMELKLTFSRAVYFGNDRYKFDYGRVAGLYVLQFLSQDSFLGREEREVVYSVTNFVCNLLSDSFVKEVKDHDDVDIKEYIDEAVAYFYNLTSKWMYMNHYSKPLQVIALQAAEYAISTRLSMVPIGDMLEVIFPFLGPQQQDIDYIMWINK